MAILITILLSVNGCGPGKPPETGSPAANQPILNIRLQQAIGPSLGNGTMLIEPTAVAVNDLGDIYISDKARNTIYKLSPSLELLSGEGGIGISAGSFNHPIGMAFDAALNLYVAESGNHRVTILDRNLHFVRSYTAYTNADGESIDFDAPSDVSLDREGNIWIADDSKALKLNPFFDLELEISNDSPGYPIIGEIVSLRTARSGLAALADRGSRQIVVIRTLGTNIGKFPIATPSAVAWDNNGNIWIAAEGKIIAYDINGNLKFEYAENEPDSWICWLAFDSAGKLYVLDSGVRRLRTYDVILGAGSTGAN